MQGFPSYLGLPVNYPILNHATGLTRYRASRYLARLPTRYAESGSLSLCAVHFLSLPSDPAVTSSALAIRIDFPLVRATSVSFNRPGLPATLGKPRMATKDRTLVAIVLRTKRLSIHRHQLEGWFHPTAVLTPWLPANLPRLPTNLLQRRTDGHELRSTSPG